MVTWAWEKNGEQQEPQLNRAQRRAQLLATRAAKRRGQRAYNRTKQEG